jgi:hypothetical protein
MRWERTAVVLTAERGREFRFTTVNDCTGRDETRWRYTMAQSPLGTELTESFHFVWCSLGTRAVETCLPRGHQVNRGIGYKDDGTIASVGVIGAFPMAKRRQLFTELQPLVTTFEGRPWNWAAHEAGEGTPRKNEGSHWNAGKDLSFVPLRPEQVVEIRYDHIEGERFHYTAQFNRWRPDRDPRSYT